MEAYKEFKNVQKCLHLIEQKLGWGSATLWHNDVFIELSEKIQEETKVLLSPTTLKRVWGKVNYNSSPSISTLNALAKFAGFSNWRAFKNQNHKPKTTYLKSTIISNLGIIIFSAFLMATVILMFFSMSNSNNSEKKNYEAVIFKSKTITKGMPNSVVFDFDLKEIESENIIIQQYWDKNKTIKIDKNQNQATGQYYFPGYFRAKLLIDNIIIKEHDLFLKSEGWLGTIDYDPIPKYISENQIKIDRKLRFSDDVFNEIIQSEKPIYSTYHYVDDLGDISGDNFELTSNISTLFTEKWGVCQKTIIYILGSKSAILVPFSIKGCVSDLGFMLSDVFMDGKKKDLSSLGVDLSAGKEIKIITKDKKIHVIIGNNEVFTENYNNSLGNLVGIRFKFLGVGEVNSFSLKNLEGKEFLKN